MTAKTTKEIHSKAIHLKKKYFLLQLKIKKKFIMIKNYQIIKINKEIIHKQLMKKIVVAFKIL
jgi:hypothetical protein